jgi:hypothetical protein
MTKAVFLPTFLRAKDPDFYIFLQGRRLGLKVISNPNVLTSEGNSATNFPLVFTRNTFQQARKTIKKERKLVGNL